MRNKLKQKMKEKKKEQLLQESSYYQKTVKTSGK